MDKLAIEYCLLMIERMTTINPNLISMKRLYQKGLDEKYELTFDNVNIKSLSSQSGGRVYKATVEIGVHDDKRTKKIKE